MRSLLVFFCLLIAQCLAVDYLRGVSLGGHLVPEPFINADIWEPMTSNNCPGAKDIWNLCECTSQNPQSSAKVIQIMQAHLQQFINLADLEAKIIRTNINSIRYPISFTYFINANQDPTEYAKYSSCGVTQSALDASTFKSILNLARRHNVRVILNLHQVQGCQNGFDNGGHAGVKQFFTEQNVQKGINIWQNMMNYLDTNGLLPLIWGFEILNEPFPDTASDLQLLQKFTETVNNQFIAPKLTAQQVVVLQPGPGNNLVAQYENYNLDPSVQYVFDFHEYIVFNPELYLNTMGTVLPIVENVAKNDFGAKKWPYFVGEWSLATTDCAEYLNAAFGGFDPDYYAKQHASRSSFFCNQIDQVRDGFTVGFQTCSVIVFNDNGQKYGHCNAGQYADVYNQYRGAVCKLWATYLGGFKQNPKNVGFSFWTYTTGAADRRIQQWDFSFAVDQGMITDTLNPTPVDQCDSLFS